MAIRKRKSEDVPDEVIEASSEGTEAADGGAAALVEEPETKPAKGKPQGKNRQPSDVVEARPKRLAGLRPLLLPLVAVTLLMVLSAAVLVPTLHSLQPHAIPIGVTGGPASEAAVAKQLEAGDDPAFDVVGVPAGETPQSLVKSREVYATLVLTDKAWQLVYAGANGTIINSQIRDALRPASGIAYTAADASPAAPGDNSTWAVFFLVLSVVVAGVACGVLVALRGAGLSSTAVLVALAGFSVVSGVATTLVVRYPLDALVGNPLVPVVLQVLLAFVASSLTLVAVRLGRLYGAAIAALLLVAVGTAFSGALLPPPYLSTGSAWLVSFLPNGLAAQGTTGASFFDGASQTGGLVGLAVWALVAVASLLLIDRRRRAHPLADDVETA